MNETKQNSTKGVQMNEKQKVVVRPLKSAFVGFLLAFLGLGWFGIDRFYKGDTKIGLFKLFCLPLVGIVWYMGYPKAAVVILGIGCVFWCLDWFLVPLGISMDNKRKLAQANTQNIAPQAEKVVQKSTTQSSIVSNAHSVSTQMSIDNNQSKDDLVAKIVFVLILLVAVIGWLARQLG